MFFKRDVQAVEIPGKEGYLGILPGHAPLITELGVGILAYRKESETRYLTVIHGYAEVLPDRVIVLAETSERAEEIDPAALARGSRSRPGGVGQGRRRHPEWEREKLAIERAAVRLEAVGKMGGASRKRTPKSSAAVDVKANAR